MSYLDFPPVLTDEQARAAAYSALGVSSGKDHIVCCDPATAICGADQRGEPFAIGAPDPKRMCSACAVLAKDPNHRCCRACPGSA